ncbi:MAG: MTAP family purine nucleoside phosphorylase [Methanobacteriota archaeon]|nr:MAG: MTAP family purine nucleoside phosphorylase [Euryarchaeota archaeon]
MESLSGERRSPDTMAPALVGIIGGSALGDAFELEEEQARFLVTPHGAPSDPPRVGVHAGVPVAFLPRHGKDHRIPPHKLNHRANLWALKEIGATHVIGTSSTGSLKKAIRPGSFVVPDDFVGFWDIPTYYDDRVVHTTPSLDASVRAALSEAAKDAKAVVRDRGVYVQTTGPRLETRAEIAFFKSIGDVVGMTMASEATLASELGLPYASLCTVDNFAHGIVDEPLTFETIRETQRANAALTRTVVAGALGRLR